MRDCIIGAADNYNLKHLLPWIESLSTCGFEGEKVLIVYRVTDGVIKYAIDRGFKVIQIDHNEYDERIDHYKGGLTTQAHQLRSFHIWQYLSEIEECYRFVMVCDTADVYFQTNPSDWLDHNFSNSHELMLPSEAILFTNEEWNRDMVLKAFGPYIFHYELEDKVACNSGTFVGRHKTMKNMNLIMFLVARNMNQSGIDQGTLNIVGRLIGSSFVEPMDGGWAAQMGTVHDPTKNWLWNRLEEPRPIIDDEFVVRTSKGEPFVVVHQWARVPQLKQFISQKYGVNV